MTNANTKSFVLLLAAGLALPLPAQDASTSLRLALNQHCVKCHGKERNVEGETNLLTLASDDVVQTRPELLQALITVLQDYQMPPEDEPPLPQLKREQMVSRLHDMLEQALEDVSFAPIPIRRMNRFQYNNAVVDLLELKRDIFQLNERLMRRRDDYFRPQTGSMPAEVRVSSRPLSKDIDNQRPEGFKGVAAFPQDKRAEHGFDNRADHLTLSPLLMESFLQLSETIVESPDLNPEECQSWQWLFAPPSPLAHDQVDDRSEPQLDQELAPSTDSTTGVDRDVIRGRIARLLRRAFRRPVDKETLERFTRFAEGQFASGTTYEDTMRTVVGAVLGMPDFLYFYESATQSRAQTLSRSETNARQPRPLARAVDGTQHTPLHKRQRVDDFELASRLSLFFWSSIPDDALLDLAEAGKLSELKTLSAQIDRMMNDRRSSRFCDNFPSQWLQLDRLITSIPDPKKFPYFYYNGYRTSMHMIHEPLLLFETIYIEDRLILELLDPEFTWESEMLRSNYDGHSDGRRDVQVQTFRRVPLEDPRRGGVITNAAIMTMTSTPTRTQPITRGAWLNAVIFNDPPEPPPADVPPLPEIDKEALAKLTIRERLAAHRQRADCAGCHDKIDPLGFALENYGPTGVWRDHYENGRKVDVRGALFHQHEFSTLIEFKRLLLQEEHRFIRGFVSHLLAYALGRELGPADSPALDAMTSQAVEGDDRLRVVLKRVAMSEPFLHKNVQVMK